MQSDSKHSGRNVIWYDFSTRLNNYIHQQEEVAKKKGIWEELKVAQTLTQARKIVYGVKVKKGKLRDV